MATRKANPSWIDIKAKLADIDRAGLLGLVQGLYAASKDNQAFLHARLHLGGEVLKPYKATIARWLWPDVFKNQDISVAKAKKAISAGSPYGAPWVTSGWAQLLRGLMHEGAAMTARKSRRWSQDVTSHGDALDLEKDTESHHEIEAHQR